MVKSRKAHRGGACVQYITTEADAKLENEKPENIKRETALAELRQRGDGGVAVDSNTTRLIGKVDESSPELKKLAFRRAYFGDGPCAGGPWKAKLAALVAAEMAAARAKQAELASTAEVGSKLPTHLSTLRRGKAARPPIPFGPKGPVEQPAAVGPGCTGPFCMPKGGKSRRRKGRKTRRRITRRR